VFRQLPAIDPANLVRGQFRGYHAVRRSLHLLGPGSTAVVIGVGGLGQMTVERKRRVIPGVLEGVWASGGIRTSLPIRPIIGKTPGRPSSAQRLIGAKYLLL
jgi:hypothetical protein